MTPNFRELARRCNDMNDGDDVIEASPGYGIR